MGGHAANAIAL